MSTLSENTGQRRTSATKTALVIQHVGFEDLDGFEAPLVDAGYAVRRVHAADGIPNAAGEHDLLIVLGGPIGVGDLDTYPVLRPELALIDRQLSNGAPLMGICLGAQLIAHAARARVYPGRAAEIGFAPIELTPDGAASCLSPFADDPVTLHWHRDVFDLPHGATRLASTQACDNQAFSIGSNVIGFQFHPEMTGRNIEHWLVGHSVELGNHGIDPWTIRADSSRFAESLTLKASSVMRSWLAGLSR